MTRPAPLAVAAVERPDPARVVVVVEHDAAQSYRRAVTPYAMRQAAAAIGPSAAAWILSECEDRGTVVPGAPVVAGTRTLRAYVFTATT